MSEFKELYQKVNGTEKLKQYAKSKVLLLALTETFLLGTSKKSLEILRLAVNNKVFQRLKKKNASFIEKFKQENDFSNMERKHRNTIWTIWLQGMENAPYIVQKCYESINRNIKDKEIIVITEDNYSDYVSFPDYIIKKYKSGVISKVHFSDLLRIELMAKHGGTWLDGTVYCSETPEQDYVLNSDLFLFQTLKPGLDGHCTSISSWLMTACSHHPIIMLTRALLHNYWKTHNYAVDYFILHDFFQIAIETYPEEWEKVVPFSNEIPHILLLRLFDEYDESVWDAVRKMTPFHKLTYKFDVESQEKENTYFKHLFD